MWRKKIDPGEILHWGRKRKKTLKKPKSSLSPTRQPPAPHDFLFFWLPKLEQRHPLILKKNPQEAAPSLDQEKKNHFPHRHLHFPLFSFSVAGTKGEPGRDQLSPHFASPPVKEERGAHSLISIARSLLHSAPSGDQDSSHRPPLPLLFRPSHGPRLSASPEPPHVWLLPRPDLTDHPSLSPAVLCCLNAG